MTVAGVLVLDAPVSGWAAPLDEVPDPVFAGRMLGDGVAIDPTAETLHSPCDGVVAVLPASRHALTIRADNGAEILLHVGVETVGLGGEGFEAHVAEGQRVRRGERLLSFDLDLLAGRARSLLTPVVLANGDAFEVVHAVTGREVRQGEPLLGIRPRGVGAPAETAAGGEAFETDVTIALPHGLHARPAARLVAYVQGLDAVGELVGPRGRASLKSAVGLLSLGARRSETLRLVTRGPAARAAAEGLIRLLDEMAREEAAQAPRPRPSAQPPSPAGVPGVLQGVTAAPGLAIGVAVRLAAPEPVVAEAYRGAEAETRALDEALARVAERLRAPTGRGGREQAEILAAHQAFLADPELRTAAQAGIAAGQSAGVAWRAAVRATADTLRALGDPLFAERADDLLDLERQVLFALSGEDAPAPQLPAGAVVIAEELMPSELIGLDPSRVAGFCTARGGATSHVAILAAAMGAPALAAIGPALLAVPDGTPVILDADAGTLRIAPDRAALEAAQGALAAREFARRKAREAARAPGRTADGERLEVFANLGAASEAAAAVAQGAEGCGLFRTEFLYLDRQTAPSEDEQLAAYQAAAEALGTRPLTIRTLDAGGDKPLAFAPTAHEANPALGLRGLRASLADPALLKTQLRAVLRVRAPGERRILLPMVSDLADLRAAKALLDEAAAELGVGRAALGVMIETPASAVLADQLAREADFLSIGTNDLAQYVLAIDREHPQLAGRLDALHPAVLRLVAQAARAGGAAGKPVGVCGGVASEPLAAPLLVGLGVRSLSAAAAAIPALKARLRAVDLPACRDLAEQALALASAAEVRALLRDRVPDLQEALP